MVRRSLTADSHVLVVFFARADRHFEHDFDGIVTLIENVRDQCRVPIQSECQLRHVIGANRHTVKMFQVLIG